MLLVCVSLQRRFNASSFFLPSFCIRDSSFGLKTFFVESVCVDPEVIAANIVVSIRKFALMALVKRFKVAQYF